jgi:hypothetical protein
MDAKPPQTVAHAQLRAPVVALVGYSSSDRPAPAPRGGRVVGTVRPYVPRTALGTRAEAVELFESRVLHTGEMNNLNDGRERWLGYNPFGSIAEVMGPADGITQVSITFRYSDEDTTENQLKAGDLALIVERYAPEPVTG